MENKKEKMFKYVEQWLSSGLSQKKFAEKHLIVEKTLSYWNSKHLHEVRNKQIHKEQIFVELPAIATPKKIPQLYMELELPECLLLKMYR